MSLVHIDLETTGLNPLAGHVACEVAWAIEDGPIKYGKVVIPDDAVIDPKAMEINRFYERTYNLPLADLNELGRDLDGATLCGMNIAFDESFLLKMFGHYIWHYRKLDIQSYAMATMNIAIPPSSTTIVNRLRNIYDIRVPEGDHTAAGDVESQRAIFKALQFIANENYWHRPDGRIKYMDRPSWWHVIR